MGDKVDKQKAPKKYQRTECIAYKNVPHREGDFGCGEQYVIPHSDIDRFQVCGSIISAPVKVGGYKIATFVFFNNIVMNTFTLLFF